MEQEETLHSNCPNCGGEITEADATFENYYSEMGEDYTIVLVCCPTCKEDFSFSDWQHLNKMDEDFEDELFGIIESGFQNLHG